MRAPNNPGMSRTLRRGVTVITLLVSMCWTAWSAHACSADPHNLISVPSRVYTSYAAGSVIADWAEVGSGNYLEKCTPNQRGTFRFSATQSSVGSIGGYETFPTSDTGIGIQVRYSYPRSRDTMGAPRWSDWVALTETANDITVVTHLGPDLDTQYVQVRLQFRFVARTDISGNRSIARGEIINVEDMSFGTTLNQKTHERFSLDAPRRPSCWFTKSPDTRVTLPDAYNMKLNKEGALSDPASFSWSWQCDAGNLGHSGDGDFKYDAATTVTDADGGRMSVTGGARGVDLLVTTTRNGDGNYVPVRFARWYSQDDGSMGTRGTEYLQVRYIRNADPDLVIGRANGGLKITLEPK
ncbi:hypothetical protein STENOSP10_25560 [Stenotrophomonas sepilia]|uniref:Adhesin n=1 Tax=Stenotrophomonas sepilia TaxID=2860290 RepID=A0ABQ6QFK3_9GAMM|nr:hypothetical protein STENOSP10_25560 [Stenotrophomonas sepilia]